MARPIPWCRRRRPRAFRRIWAAPRSSWQLHAYGGAVHASPSPRPSTQGNAGSLPYNKSAADAALGSAIAGLLQEAFFFFFLRLGCRPLPPTPRVGGGRATRPGVMSINGLGLMTLRPLRVHLPIAKGDGEEGTKPSPACSSAPARSTTIGQLADRAVDQRRAAAGDAARDGGAKLLRYFTRSAWRPKLSPSLTKSGLRRLLAMVRLLNDCCWMRLTLP